MAIDFSHLHLLAGLGLDMYLVRRTYVKNADYMKPDERHEVIVRRGAEIRADIKPERVSAIEEQIAYWRKANAIHKWFVENVQDGEDDCKEYWVSREKLTDLHAAVSEVLAHSKLVKGHVKNGDTYTAETGWTPNIEEGEYIEDPSVAMAVLPTEEGFFFGSCDYDQWYYRDLAYTKEVIGKLLHEEGDLCADIYYRSSW